MTAADRRAPRALLLTAGLGTRLQPLTYVRAKAAVPINGEALVRRVIRGLALSGISDLVLNLHHRPASIAALVGDGSDLGVSVRYSWEQPVLGSAGGPRHALPLVTDSDDDDFLIVNGDTLTDVGRLVAPRAPSRIRRAHHDGPRPEPAAEPLWRGHRLARGLGHGVHDGPAVERPEPRCCGRVSLVPFHRRAGGERAGVRDARGRRSGRVGQRALSVVSSPSIHRALPRTFRTRLSSISARPATASTRRSRSPGPKARSSSGRA